MKRGNKNGRFKRIEHPDHSGALKSFPNAKIYCSEEESRSPVLKNIPNIIPVQYKDGAYYMIHEDITYTDEAIDDTLSDREIMDLIDISYGISNIKGEWIVPANPKYYDIVNAFNETDTIIWKQSNNIVVGDIVYLYVAEPYSAILYKCETTETDIPYKYKDKNIAIKKVMKIKLLNRYKQDEFTFKKLNEYGIKAIRGPRSVTNKLSKELNKK